MCKGIEFTWEVATAGYQWTEALADRPSTKASPGALYTQLQLVPLGSESRQYAPLQEYTGLFRTFCDVDHSPEGLLLFAKDYGPLLARHAGSSTGTDPLRQAEAPSDSPKQEPDRDTARKWLDEAWDLHQAIDLWEWTRQRNAAAIAPFIRWQKGSIGELEVVYQRDRDRPSSQAVRLGAIAELGEAGAGSLATCDTITPRSGGDHIDWTRPDAVLEPAHVFLERTVNRHLTYCPTKLRIDPTSGRSETVFAPANLRNALWLQLALAIVGDKKYRRCDRCGRWFELTSKRTRIPRMYCSAACNLRAQRAKQARARQLYFGGKKFKEIARELGSDVSTIKRWVTGRR